MDKERPAHRSARHAMTIVRHRIEAGGEKLWRLGDFRDLPASAVAQALSRLAQQRKIERLSKGIYYRPRDTAFGKSKPNPAQMRELIPKDTTVFPSPCEVGVIPVTRISLPLAGRPPSARSEIFALYLP